MLLPSGYCRGNSYMVLVPVLSSRSLCNSWFIKLKLRHSCDNLSDLSKLPESQWRYFKAVFTGRMILPMLCDFGKINRWKPPFGLISSLSADIQAVSMYSITLHKSRCSNIAFSETAGLPKKTFSHLNPWVSVASSCSDAATKWKNLGKLLVYAFKDLSGNSSLGCQTTAILVQITTVSQLRDVDISVLFLDSSDCIYFDPCSFHKFNSFAATHFPLKRQKIIYSI